MNNHELNNWRDGLALPFSGIRDAKHQLSIMRARYDHLSEDARRLLESFNDLVKNRTSPVYLHRSAANTSKVLKWRLSGAKIFNFGDKARSHALLTPDVLTLLEDIIKDKDLIAQIVEFDFKRTHLNYALSYTYAEIKRLENYIEEFEIWRKLPGQVTS
jgi:hypothetical protein